MISNGAAVEWRTAASYLFRLAVSPGCWRACPWLCQLQPLSALELRLGRKNALLHPLLRLVSKSREPWPVRRRWLGTSPCWQAGDGDRPENGEKIGEGIREKGGSGSEAGNALDGMRQRKRACAISGKVL